MSDPLNAKVAARLDEVALLLEGQGANPFRVSAYRQGAETLRSLDRPVSEIVEEEGLDGLDRLPAIGASLARSIRTLVTTGRLPLLERLRGESGPQRVLMTLPGVGPILADRAHAELGIESLEDLEAAAFDGRLQTVEGFGDKRVAGIRDVLAQRLGRVPRGRSPGPPPSVAELLDVDREYRQKAQAGKLRKIAPRRFNPSGKAWLPILHTRRGEHEYTALFSNTARAHELDKTQDWVVIYCDDGSRERTSTVITSQFGLLQGKRIVRGRETECAAYYEGRDAPLEAA